MSYFTKQPYLRLTLSLRPQTVKSSWYLNNMSGRGKQDVI